MSAPETETITTFGSYLRFLRRRARLTQTELGIAVGYSPGQISMLENGQRSPNRTTIAALFVPALGIEHDDQRRRHLLALAEASAPAQSRPPTHEVVVAEAMLVSREEIGQLEEIAWVPAYAVLRQAPLKQLRRWLARERCVALCGMGGMGKSTLAAQLAGGYAEQGGVFWMTCSNAAALVPEGVVRQLALFVATQIRDPQRMAAVLRPPATGNPTIAYAQQLAMVTAALAELDAPLLIFDDAQLLNGAPPMGQLFNQLLTRVPGCHILFVTREELSLPGIVHMHLGGLEREELVLLQERLMHIPGIDIERLERQTGGNPMLVRLAISYWEQYGAQGDTLPFPAVSYLIESILSTLNPAARRLLDLLAIWRGPLNLTLPQIAGDLTAYWPDHDHAAGLIQIQRSRVIEHVSSAAPHPLLREPLLIDIQAREPYFRQLHLVAVQVALQLDDPIRAAHHFAQAGELQRAYALIVEQTPEQLPPGQGALMAATVEELLALLQSRQPERWRQMQRALLVLRGDLLVNTTRADDAQASYYEALALTTAPAEHARLAEKIAMCAYRRGALDEALTLCDEAAGALRIAISKEAIQLRIQIESTRIRILITLARFDEARKICETALALVRPAALLLPGLTGTVRAYANLTLGYIARFQGDNVLARQYLHKSVQQAHVVKAASVEMDALQYLSSVLRDMGDMAGAEEIGQRALDLAHTAGNEYVMSSILHHLSLTDYYHADLERALWRTQRVLQLKVPMGDIEGIVASRMVQAIVLAAQGEVQAAWETASQAGRDCDLLENSWLRGVADYGHAVVLSFTDDLTGAERYLLRALATTMLKRDIPFYTGAQIYLGLIYVAQGRLAEADAIITPDLPTGAGYSAELLRELVRGMWLVGSGRCEEARVCAERLAERAKQTGFLIYAQEGNRLAALTNNPPSLAILPRMVCCPPPG